MNNDDRDYYRTKSDSELLKIAREDGVTAEMGVVLAERLCDVHARWEYGGHTPDSDYRAHGWGQYQPRSN